LSAMGIGIALDDFGTGYSSLRLLRAFPFGKIKIDMSFVRDIGRSSDSTAIIRAIIGLARELGLTTAAEGIETQAQWNWLTEQGCDEGQGFHVSEPLTAAQIQGFLAECVTPSAHFQPMFDAAGHPKSNHVR
ncbi:MAG: EAL domain-containing protein, partial [Dokdonella sp.]